MRPCYARSMIRGPSNDPMALDDLTRPLRKRPTNQWSRAIVLPVIAGTLSGVLSGLAILFAGNLNRGERALPVPAAQSAVADSVQQTAPIAAPVTAPLPAMPTAKTITLTVVDSQTGARREVVVPAPTSDQSEGELALGSATPITAADKPSPLARARRGAAKLQSH
jgi:hypothetical protein